MLTKKMSFRESSLSIVNKLAFLKKSLEDIEYVSGNKSDQYISITNKFVLTIEEIYKSQQVIIATKDKLTEPEKAEWRDFRQAINNEIKESLYALIKVLKTRKENVGFSDKNASDINLAEEIAVTAIDFILVKEEKDELLSLKYIQEILKRIK